MRSGLVRSLFLLTAVIFSCEASAVVLDPPSLRCASVQPNGDVLLSFLAPPDPNGDFSSYSVYHAGNLAGPYALVGSIAVYGQATYLHAGAGANGGQQFYYLTTTSGSPPPNTSVPSDTLGTLFLQVTQSAPLGSALLSWTPQHSPPLGTALGQYTIFMEYPLGTWTPVGSVPNTTLNYAEVISICEDSLNFRIRLENASGCFSESNATGAVFADATPPSSPNMTVVSVDTTSGLATLSWAPSPELDTDGYIIVLSQPPPIGNAIIDTVYGRLNTFYTYTASQAGSGPECYTLAAIDTCFTGNPPSPNTSASLAPHCTVYTTTSYDRCAGIVTIDWTFYEGAPIQYYEVYVQEGGGPWALLGTFSPFDNSTQQSGVDPFTTYCYVVKAYLDSGTSTSLSNKACRVTDYPAIPQFNYIRTATVLGPEEVLVVDSIDSSAEVRRYLLERSTNGGPYMTVAVQAGVGGGVIQFTDFDVDTDERSYTYRVQVQDSCGNDAVTSNIGNTIHLRAEAGLDGFNRLIWNGYEDWAGQVSGYAILRSVAGGPYTLLATNAPGVWSYVDDVRDLDATNGSFCYQVQALEAGNPSGLNATSESNIVCAIQEAQVWIPNAFIAGGYNSNFVPVTAYTDLVDYEFTIINRWGQEIWTSNTPGEPWKGVVNGNYVPQGVYGYYCAFRNGEGRIFEKRGTVTFIWGLE